MSAAADVRRLLPQLERAKAHVARLEHALDDAGAAFSFERGYRVPLRRDQLQRELAAAAKNSDPVGKPPATGSLGRLRPPSDMIPHDPAVEAGRVTHPASAGR